MKKILLLLSIVIAASTSYGQLTQANEPLPGIYPMYVIDSVTVSPMATYAAVSGTSAVWDYSTAIMYADSTEDLAIAAVTGSTNFPAATKSIFQGTIKQFFHSSTSLRTVDGFEYTDPTLGTVVIKYTSGNNYLTYPFAYSNTVNNTTAGNAEGIPMQGAIPFTGTISTTIDGTGTLKLANADVTGVIRLKIVEVVTASTFIGTITLTRTQFEYYKLDEQNAPIFVDAMISMNGTNERQILSKKFATVGIENVAIDNFMIFPNPAAESFTVNGDFTKGAIEVTDLAGRIVYNAEVNAGSTVQLTDAKAGVYTVKVIANGKTAIQKLTIK